MTISTRSLQRTPSMLENKSELRTNIFPLNGREWDDQRISARTKTLEVLKAENLNLETQDHRKIDAVWIKQENTTPKTAILFHGNGIILDGMRDFAQYFKDKEMNVLMITMGGYPGSEGNTTELTTYHDTAAAVDFVFKTVNASPSDIIAYGYSLGASLALQAGQEYGTHVIADRPFGHLVKNIPDIAIWPFSLILKRKARKAFPKNVHDFYYATTGFDNIEKARELAKHNTGLAVLYAKKDGVIPNPKNKAKKIAQAFNESSEKLNCEPIVVPGDHSTANFLDHTQVRDFIDRFIKHHLFPKTKEDE